MKHRTVFFAVLALATTTCTTLKSPPGRPSAESQVVPPSEIMDFDILYGKNCAGCHGVNGRGGPAIGLGDPAYLAIADDPTILRVTADGVSGSPMPAFAQSAGGTLTTQQIDALVNGMRARWADPDIFRGVNPPPYSAQGPGDPTRGARVYTVYCSSCHGPDGRGGPKASSIVDGSYLALVSDQGLRTIVIVGRPEFGAPDWRGNVPNRPMPPQDISDVVAWLASQRPEFPGQPYASAQRTPGEFR
jgi:mono/diheme cytochrome c family protein